MRTKTLFLVATVAAGVVLGPLPAASAETQYGTRDRPLETQRYETLRALAHHLDETARGALEGATDAAEPGAGGAAAHVVAALSGPRLQEFRQLVHDIDISATGAHARARREVGSYPDRGRQ